MAARWNSSRAPDNPLSEAMMDFEMCEAHLNPFSLVARLQEGLRPALVGVPHRGRSHGHHVGFSLRVDWGNSVL